MLKMSVVIDHVVPDHAALLAGQRGRNKVISNIHTIENLESAKFAKSSELILITGVALTPKNTLEDLIQALVRKSVSGIIINEGFYIKGIPEKVVTLCDEADIPLISLPWRYVLSDLQKTIFRELLSSQYQSSYRKYILSQLLHNAYLPHTDYEELLNYSEKEHYLVILIEFPEALPESSSLWSHALRSSLADTELDVIEEKKRLILILHGQRLKDNAEYEQWLAAFFAAKHCICRGGLGDVCNSWKELADSFDAAEAAIMVATEIGRKPPFFVSSQESTFLKIIRKQSDPKLLKRFVQETLGKLIQYDEKNNTDVCHFLQVWLKHSGNPSKVAAELYVHRNTVAYRINKVKTILGCKDLTYPLISKLFFAFLLKNSLAEGTNES